MAKEFTKEDVIQQKKISIRALNNLLEKYINDSSEKHLKKAYLISYWLSDFTRLIDFEEKFIPTKNIAYKRGNIIKLNFGFNIGSEYGGLHYGIVLDNKNEHNSPVVTVIPLTSIKDSKPIHHNSVELGNEVYRLLKIKFDTLLKAAKEDLEQVAEMQATLKAIISSAQSALTIRSAGEFIEKSDIQKDIDKADDLQRILQERLDCNNNEINYLEKIGKEIAGMKEGSIALVNQITTVSKMRIYDPKNSKGVLASVSLSQESMEKINQKIKDLFVFS